MDEFHRLRCLHSYHILDTDFEADFDQLTWLAAHVCAAPIAVLTLVDEKRQWFKSVYGLDVRETPREIAFCNHAIQHTTPFFIEDATTDIRFVNNPLVTGAPWIRSYLGIPLISPDGFAIGTLAVIDRKPNTYRDETIKALSVLAQQAIHNLNTRRERLSSEQAAHNRVKDIISAAATGIAVSTLDGKYLLFNPYYFSLFGYTAEEMSRTTLADILCPDDFPEIQIKLRSLYKNQCPNFILECRCITKQKNIIWVRAQVSMLRDAEQKPLAFVGVVDDITENKIAHEKNKQLTKRLQSTLESITDAFFALDKNWCFTYVNIEAERLLERRRDDLLGNNIWQEFPEAVGTAFEFNYHKAMDNGVKIAFEEYYAPLKTWFGVNAYPSTEGISVYFQNITERRIKDDQLRLMEACIARMNDLIVVTEAEPIEEPGPRIIYVNDAFIKQTGYALNEVIGRSPRFLQGPNTPRNELDKIKTAMRKWQPVRAELINYTKAGEEFWLEVDIFPIADKTGWFTHWVSVERDITERKKIEEIKHARQLAELANEAKSNFLATMSHEIRTPISGVIGMVDLLHQTSLKGYQIEMVDIIRNSANSLLDIIDDILDFSKIESGKLALDNTLFSPEKNLEDVSLLLDRMALEKNVELSLHIDSALPERIIGDELRLRQILINLVNNAIKFSANAQPYGKVRISIKPQTQTHDTLTIAFIISDNGIGMSEKTLAQLFTPFMQADASTTRHYGGTGLGLTITRHLVELMGGEIEVRSREGSGTTFTVRIPFLISQNDKQLVAQPHFSRLLSIVVGSNSDMASIWAEYLQSAGATLVQFFAAELIHWQELQRKYMHYQILVLIDDCEKDTELTPNGLINTIQSLHPQIYCLTIGRGQRRELRRDEHGNCFIDGNCLGRARFFEAVQIAIGQKQLTTPQIRGHHEQDFIPPLRSDALAQGRLLLLAEDNETNQKLIARQLGLLGYAVDIVDNGEQAFARLHHEHYAMLITDIHMPVMDGYELIRKVRSSDAAINNIPIIALSANAMGDEAEKCAQLGANEYLVKPALLPDLKKILDRYLTQHDQLNIVSYEPHAPVMTHTETAQLDVNILRDLVGDDELVINEFLRDYLRNARQLQQQISNNITQEDYPSAAGQLHKLKSSSRAVGALALGKICEHMEFYANKKMSTELANHYCDFENEFHGVEQLIAENLNNTGEDAERLH